MKQEIIVKIQTISDVITNSSSSIFEIKSDLSEQTIYDMIYSYHRGSEEKDYDPELDIEDMGKGVFKIWIEQYCYDTKSYIYDTFDVIDTDCA